MKLTSDKRHNLPATGKTRYEYFTNYQRLSVRARRREAAEKWTTLLFIVLGAACAGVMYAVIEIGWRP